MLYSTRGIVIKGVKYGETSLILKVFTEAFGLRSYMINGVRKARSKAKASILQPLNILDMVVYERPNKNLQRIKEYKSGHIFTSLPFDVRKSAIGLFISEILHKTIKEEETNEALFSFVEQFIFGLDESEDNIAVQHLGFLIELTKYLGFYPRTNFSAETPVFDLQEGFFVDLRHRDVTHVHPPQSRLLAEAINGEKVGSLNKSERRELLQVLLMYYECHVEHFSKVRSVDVLQEVLA